MTTQKCPRRHRWLACTRTPVASVQRYGRSHRVGAHRFDQGLISSASASWPAADGGAGPTRAFATVDTLEPIQRQVVLPAPDNGVHQQAGAGSCLLRNCERVD